MKYRNIESVSSPKRAYWAWALLFTFLVLLSAKPGIGQAAEDRRYEGLHLGGLLMDQTQTPMGRHFFQEFSSYWQAPETVKDFNISVVERFNPQWGSLVLVEVDGKPVLQSFLSRRDVDVEQVAKEAVSKVYQYLLRREILKRYQRNDDLYGEGY
jgi:curli production assembly/transport component CsgE